MTLRLSMNLRTLPLLLLACLGIFLAEPAVADRIPQAIDNTRVWRLRGSVPPLARPEADRGASKAAGGVRCSCCC